MFNKILVPLDGSELASSSLPQVAELAKKFNRRIPMEIMAEYWSRSSEINQTGIMLYGLVHLIVCIWMSRFMKRP